ncbi:MAG: hypothetical protein MI725_17405 [Pirellulales bacterium]|nr:hypothetical protein [Pirellulales bacterium]
MASLADSRGNNWAISSRSRDAVPVRRTIQVVVRKDRLAILPSQHTTQVAGLPGVEISLNKSSEQVAEELVAALRERVEDWGLAGNGLYWRPVLTLHIGPEAKHTAAQFVQLLKNSGVEVRLPETAERERSHAQR